MLAVTAISGFCAQRQPGGGGGGPAGAHRYWQVVVNDNNSGSHTIAGLVELQFHVGTNGFGADAAEGGTASADTDAGAGFEAANGFDDAYLDASGNAWTSGSGGFPHYLRYDFGSDTEVLGVSIVARAVNSSSIESAPRDFDVQYSDDGSSWTTAWSETGVTWTAYQFQHFLSPDAGSYTGSPHGAHTYWRVRTIVDDGGTIAAASEIEMRATPSGADQCTGGTAIGTQHPSLSFPPSQAFDNNNSTFWASTTTGDAQNVGYQFASPVVVAEITWRNRGDSAANQAPVVGIVQYSDNGTTWTTAWTFTGQTGWTLGQTRTFTDPNYV